VRAVSLPLRGCARVRVRVACAEETVFVNLPLILILWAGPGLVCSVRGLGFSRRARAVRVYGLRDIRSDG
jgi:hypothetical protein